MSASFNNNTFVYFRDGNLSNKVISVESRETNFQRRTITRGGKKGREGDPKKWRKYSFMKRPVRHVERGMKFLGNVTP